jgi:hypothetical protein
MDNVVTEWLKFSDTDFLTAKYLFENMQPAPLEIICSHRQQSAEKALKAKSTFKTKSIDMLGIGIFSWFSYDLAINVLIYSDKIIDKNSKMI